ncbi:MAG: lipoyl(octanoyl) transferase LipB [Parcubacteria group bacterium]|nr:lipoyl(octanoyl) transferase LipB [Parcubacteria group bacterium]
MLISWGMHRATIMLPINLGSFGVGFAELIRFCNHRRPFLGVFSVSFYNKEQRMATIQTIHGGYTTERVEHGGHMRFTFEVVRGEDGGPCPLSKALARQEEVFAQISSANPLQGDCHIIFAEHTPVYTWNAAKRDLNRILRVHGSDFLPAPMVDVGRAGSVSFHGPGQVTCYIITRLDSLKLDVPTFARLLDVIVIDTLGCFDIKSFPKPPNLPTAASGVWIDHKGSLRKISSRGIRLSRGVSRFGFALNISTDLSYFDYIYPCGLDIQMISMKKLGIVAGASTMADVIAVMQTVIQNTLTTHRT